MTVWFMVYFSMHFLPGQWESVHPASIPVYFSMHSLPAQWVSGQVYFVYTRPLPAFGRQGLDADTRDFSPRAFGARRVGGIEWGAPTDLLSN